MALTLRTCETCGFTFYGQYRRRWCPDCFDESSARAKAERRIPTQRAKARAEHALALTVTEQTLHIRQALHSLSMAAWARQLGWDDRPYLDAATDALLTVPTTAQALAPSTASTR